MKTIKEGIGDENQQTKVITATPFSHKKYIDDITKLAHTGHVSSDKQKNNPLSAGARGLAQIHDFAFSKPNQLMKANEQKWRVDTLEDIKITLSRIDSINKK